MPPLWRLPIGFCDPRCTATSTMTGLSIPWCCPSTIYAVFLCNVHHPLFLAVWSSAAYRDDRHGRTMVTDSKSSCLARILTCCHTYIFVCFMLPVWYPKHSPIKFRQMPLTRIMANGLLLSSNTESIQHEVNCVDWNQRRLFERIWRR